MNAMRFGFWVTLLALPLAGCDQVGCETGSSTANGAQQVAPSQLAPQTGAAAPSTANARPQTKPGAITIEVVDRAGYQSVLDKYRGKAIFVDFWATWCVQCRLEFPKTVELARKYAADGLVVISVSMDDPDANQADALKFLEQQHADFPNLLSKLGSGSASMDAFDVDNGALPHYKLYDREGKLIQRFASDETKKVDHSEVDAAVRMALGLAADK